MGDIFTPAAALHISERRYYIYFLLLLGVNILTTIKIIILPCPQYLIVTGGYRYMSRVDTTEIYSYKDNVWTEAGKLPARMSEMRAATFNNRVLLFGN